MDQRWWLAFSLQERLRGGAPSPSPGGPGFDELQRLEADVFGEGDNDAVFRALGFTRGALAGLLEEKPDALARRLPPPAWARDFHEVFQTGGPCTESLEEVLSGGDWRRRSAVIGWPLLDRARRQIDEFVRSTVEHRGIPHDGRALRRSLLELFTARIATLALRTLVYEAHQAGTDFHAYTSALGAREMVWDVLLKYPVLARELMRVYRSSISMIEEVVQRVSTDWWDLPCSHGRLERIVGLASDPHNGGREVLRVECGAATIIYKPRSCAADDLFYRRLLPFIEPDIDPALVKIILRDGYSWMPFVEHLPCSSTEELDAFFRRTGRLIALSYFMGITDLHCENIIARGALPVPIDLETILHPEILSLLYGHNRADAHFSLFDTLLVPGVPRGMGVDIAGLSKVDRRESVPLPNWEQVQGEAPRVVEKPTLLPARDNLPRLALGEQALAEHHYRALAVGLEEGYRAVLTRTDEVEKIIHEFEGVPTRVVVRGTSLYMQLLADSRHPSLLTDGLQRDCWLLQLGTSDCEDPLMLSVLPAEWDALARGDVPVFWARGGRQELFTHGESQRVVIWPVAGVEQVRARLRSPAPLERLQWQLQCGLAVGGQCQVDRADRSWAPRGDIPLRPLDKARAIGDALLQLAVGTDCGGLDWLTVRREGVEEKWSIHALGVDLYEGLAGIALYLLYLGKATQQAVYTKGGERGLWEAFLRWKSSPASHGGGYIGAGSLLYALMHAKALGVDWSQHAIDEIIDWIIEEPGVDPGMCDVLYGDAGLLLVVLRMIAHRRGCSEPEDTRWTTLASDLASRLTKSAVPGEDGAILWRPGPKFGQNWLCGLSHGASGLALALAEAARVLDAPALRPYVVGALRYEEQVFDETKGTWLNVISEDAEAIGSELNRDVCSWCNGAPGISLVRLILLSDGGYEDVNPQLSRDIERSIRAIEHGLPRLVSDCLCHGTAGTLEVAFRLWRATRSDSPPTWMTDALAHLSNIDVTDYLCSNAYRLTTPGLMTGLAGIGMFWLRMADSSSVPCVMTLEGPC
ncbi:type 2 lanthipeptide synthetase LanM [Nannocystis sp. ncelm1]|uniref:Type 2 lanthipeptide synthetase LanM n=2 Tax=Nannocystis radixulma TaxID=2995305 RepID=A0ABT5B5R9_9BACT|nr:type 2 lanthipeptide synthetase LanM [Nannocystis radixulma]